MANPTHGIRPLLTVQELGAILRRSPKTIRSDLRRAPWRVPPPTTPKGTRRPQWRPEVVEQWLQDATGQSPTRHPRKQKRGADDAAHTSQIAAQVAAELDASARVQVARTPPPGEPAQPGAEPST